MEDKIKPKPHFSPSLLKGIKRIEAKIVDPKPLKYDIICDLPETKHPASYSPFPPELSSPKINNITTPIFLGPRYKVNDIKGFLSLEDAISAFEHYIYPNELKLEFNHDVGFNYKLTFQVLILCKFVLTVYLNFQEFCKHYNIIFNCKRFWKRTTWKASYNRANYTFEISSGFNDSGSLSYGIHNNKKINLEHYLSTCLSDYILTAKEYVPQKRFDEFVDKLNILNKISRVGGINFDLHP